MSRTVDTMGIRTIWSLDPKGRNGSCGPRTSSSSGDSTLARSGAAINPSSKPDTVSRTGSSCLTILGGCDGSFACIGSLLPSKFAEAVLARTAAIASRRACWRNSVTFVLELNTAGGRSCTELPPLETGAGDAEVDGNEGR
jgi:hypothetical protein